MSRLPPKTVKIVIVTFVAIVASALVLVYPYDTTPLISDRATSVISISLPYPFNGYSWRANSSIVLCGREGASVVFVETSIDSHISQTNKWLSTSVSAVNKELDRPAQWLLNSDGNKLAALGYKSGHLSIVEFDLVTLRQSQTLSVDGIALLSKFSWQQDRDRWLLTGMSNRGQISVLKDGSTGITVASSAQEEQQALGFGSGDSVLFLQNPSLEGDFRLKVQEFGLSEPFNLRRSWEVQFPFKCDVLSATISPRGTRILWTLRRKRLVPTLMRAGRFPYFRFDSPKSRCSIWISDLDNGRFTCLGDALSDDAYTSTFQWSPDERTISYFMNGRILIIPIY